MTDRLKGKNIIVTGASSGMGKSTAIEMAKQGANVVLVARTMEKLEAVKNTITTNGGTAEYFVGDTSLEATNKGMVDFCREKFGFNIHAAFINAGSLAQFKLTEATEEQVDGMIDTNLKSVVWALKYLMPAMKESSGKGSIIVTTSCMGENARNDFAGSGLYSATKAAANMVVKYAAIEGAEDGTRVNAIAPGIVATGLVGLSEAEMDGFGAAKQLSGRAGRGEEIASLVTYLASDESSFITGSVYTIDGGWSLKA